MNTSGRQSPVNKKFIPNGIRLLFEYLLNRRLGVHTLISGRLVHEYFRSLFYIYYSLIS